MVYLSRYFIYKEYIKYFDLKIILFSKILNHMCIRSKKFIFFTRGNKTLISKSKFKFCRLLGSVICVIALWECCLLYVEIVTPTF